ncbi:MAG TPA: AMP-binding protein, partial [Acidimicrobiales bacterium]
RAWDAGDAVFPLDLRLPGAARERVLAHMAPARVVDETGEHRLEGGRPVEPGDALVVATSGTTGGHKGVVLTHDAVRASAQATSARLGVDPQRDRWLACLPLAHVGGLSVVTRALATGTPVEVLPGFDADLVSVAAAGGATLVSLVATALARIDASVFRTIVLGGARPPASLPANVVTTYGMTETGSGVVYDGRPLDMVELHIDGDGELHVRAPMLLRAYRDGTVPLDSGGWFATGDIARWEGDRLVVEGRRGDLIITGGENVWPDPVEEVLRADPAVADVVVAGRPDAEWGQTVVAYVVPVDASAPPSLEALRSVVKEVLPAFCAPRRLVLVDAIPRTALGKPRRADLP